jgi:N-dimethylarginine dimethylaminohydrolase
VFQNVIVRKPARSLVEGITSAPELGRPDYDLAVKQHQAYREALAACGVTALLAAPLLITSRRVEGGPASPGRPTRSGPDRA